MHPRTFSQQEIRKHGLFSEKGKNYLAGSAIGLQLASIKVNFVPSGHFGMEQPKTT
jgi:hypothetical protein